jgi:hypothetical protein
MMMTTLPRALTRDQVLDGAMRHAEHGWGSARVIAWMAWHAFNREILHDHLMWVMICVANWAWAISRIEATLRGRV